jgi:hypothetical protein
VHWWVLVFQFSELISIEINIADQSLAAHDYCLLDVSIISCAAVAALARQHKIVAVKNFF